METHCNPATISDKNALCTTKNYKNYTKKKVDCHSDHSTKQNLRITLSKTEN